MRCGSATATIAAIRRARRRSEMTAVAEQKPAGRMKAHMVRGGGGLRLHVREWGKADGPPILFIHGWSQNHLCWDKQYESPLRDEFRLVAYDLRGHGMSEAAFGTLIGPGFLDHFVDLTADDLPANIRGMRAFLRACLAKPVPAGDFETAL